MMRHRCLNFLKHKRIVREYADRQISRIRPDRRGGEERLYNLCFSYNEAEYPYLYQELEREIQRITDSLPQRCREVFILSRFQGMKNREIAERLHISLQAVEKHIQKALRIFSEMLGRENSLYTILILLLPLLSFLFLGLAGMKLKPVAAGLVGTAVLGVIAAVWAIAQAKKVAKRNAAAANAA